MEMILYVVAGIFWEVYLIVECLNKRKMYEFTVMDIIIAMSVITFWPIVILFKIFKIPFGKVIHTFIKK